jgi:cytochrome c
MHTTTANKVALAVLTALLGTMALGVFSSAVFAPQKPAKPGYDLPSGAPAASAAKPAAATPEVPLPALLAKADVKKGETFAKACMACHTFEKGGGVKVGPPLYGVVGRKIASVPGYSYSDSIKSSLSGDWTYDELFKWLDNPRNLASGTKMGFPGEPDPQKRADILAYLQTLSDSPVPFPK